MADPSRGDWQCPNEQCWNHTNYPNAYVYGSNVNCKKCGTGRTAQRAGDWCCPNPGCINQTNCVYGSKANCPKCGTPKPPVTGGGGKGAAVCMPVQQQAFGMMAQQQIHIPGMGVSPNRPGDWHCPNANCKNHTGNVVYGSKQNCPLCGEAKPAQPVMASVQAQAPRQFAAAQAMPAAFGGLAALGMTAAQQQMSKAQTAGFLGMPVMGGKGGGRPGDWHCPNANCKNHVGNVVYGSKDACPLCNTPRPENPTPVQTAMPSQQFAQPMFSQTPNMRPGDWHCSNPNCKNHTGNVVYASKTICPLCGTPKDEEARERSRSPRGLVA